MLLATVHTRHQVVVVPVLEPGTGGHCRRYGTPEEAMADAYTHSALRVGGGLLVNVCTGRTRTVPPA